MLAISIILLVLEIILGVYFYFAIFNEKKSTKKKLISYIGILIINSAIYIISMIYCYAILKLERNIIIDIVTSILGVIKLFTLNFFEEIVLIVCKEHFFFSICVALGSLLAITTTITATLTFFNAKLINHLNLKKALKKESCDLIMGCSSLELNYAKTSKNAVLFVKEETSKEEINSLIDDGYIVISKNFELDILKSKLFNNETIYHFIYFEEEEKTDKSIDYIKTFKELLKDRKHYNFYLHIDTNYNKAETLRIKLIEPDKLNANIITFSKEELLCRDLVEKLPLTKYLPDGFINEDCTINNSKVINVFILGFDNEQSLLTKTLIMNNQLATLINDKYTPYLINYYLIDENINKKNIALLANIDHKYNKIKENKKLYFDCYYKLANIEFKELNPYSQETLDFIEKHIDNKDSYNYIFISTQNDYEGINFTEKLFFEFDSNNYHLINRTKHLDLVDNENKHDNITYYGDYNKILTHDVVVNEKLSDLAINFNLAYNEKVGKKSVLDWNSMSFINIYSNIYAAINVRLKLNLLGYDYDNYEDISLSLLVSEQEYFINYTNNNVLKDGKSYIFDTKYENYFINSRRNALIYQEHLRWNAFYLLNGYTPIKKENVDYVEGKIYNKDHNKKLHACLTSFEGLDQLSNHLVKISSRQENKEYVVSDFDYYKYDASTVEKAYFILKKLGFGIYKK